jgi:hypothetical protein
MASSAAMSRLCRPAATRRRISYSRRVSGSGQLFRSGQQRFGGQQTAPIHRGPGRGQDVFLRQRPALRPLAQRGQGPQQAQVVVAEQHDDLELRKLLPQVGADLCAADLRQPYVEDEHVAPVARQQVQRAWFGVSGKHDVDAGAQLGCGVIVNAGVADDDHDPRWPPRSLFQSHGRRP